MRGPPPLAAAKARRTSFPPLGIPPLWGLAVLPRHASWSPPGVVQRRLRNRGRRPTAALGSGPSLVGDGDGDGGNRERRALGMSFFEKAKQAIQDEVNPEAKRQAAPGGMGCCPSGGC